jgi:hypothetical protein
MYNTIRIFTLHGIALACLPKPAALITHRSGRALQDSSANHHHEFQSLPLLFLEEEFPLPCLLITHQRPGPAKQVCHAFITLDFSGYLRFI